MKMYSIVAMGKNNVIGKDGGIPWHIPNDFKYVKEKTMGKTLVMGRKNFESIGRTLPGRRTIILTRDMTYKALGCEIAYSVDDVMNLCETDEDVYIFGGQEIYEVFMPYVTRLYITDIKHEFEGDTFFPKFNEDEWKEVSSVQGLKDEKNRFEYYFKVFDKIVEEKL